MKDTITMIIAITNLQVNFISFAKSSSILSGSVYILFMNSPTPISSNAIAGISVTFAYKSLLTFFINFFSRELYNKSVGTCIQTQAIVINELHNIKYFMNSYLFPSAIA